MEIRTEKRDNLQYWRGIIMVSKVVHWPIIFLHYVTFAVVREIREKTKQNVKHTIY
jgi:hypothetical protein